MNYTIGLDVGIGSVGWAVVRNDENLKRIEDYGVRIFDSGEDPKTREKNSQKRRSHRSVRRLERRRSHRKWRIKAHFQNIGLASIKSIDEYFETASPNIINLRVKALDEQITPQELAACLINICNRRGYREFYDSDTEMMTKEELEEYEREHSALAISDKLMREGKYRSVAEMILKDSFFDNDSSEFRTYRNTRFNENKVLFKREMLRAEVIEILNRQSKYYSNLTQNYIDYIVDVIFNQRDFEDGPGNPEDKYRQYSGFLDSIGKCTFYKEENRGNRFTLIADIYSLVNVVSQYIFVDTDTGEIKFTSELAKSIIDFALSNGNISQNDIKKLAKENNLKIQFKSESKFSDCMMFSKALKKHFDNAGFDWYKIACNYSDTDSILNRIGIILSENITPRRRLNALNAIDGLSDGFIKELSEIRTKGNCAVSFKYMKDSIDAFLNGESYGVFQAKMVKKIDAENTGKRYKTLPPFDENSEFFKNPVVMRAINETRKVINAIIQKYGSPAAINIEVGSELNKSLESRQKEEKSQRENEKNNSDILNQVAELLNIDKSKVSPAQIERYKLGEEQEWKSLYSGKPITSKKAAVENKDHMFEVDHIVPYSLILDNTISNKALVYHSENQVKGQRTPLMYLSGDEAKAFIGRVNALYRGKTAKSRKYQYLMLKDFDSELLSEWKSRNINDTRYISKFLVRYLSDNLIFNEESDRFNGNRVYAVKGAITSRMRRQWLNENTWGVKDKSELKKVTYLDHAVDAVVIANCLPAFVEIAGLNQKLRDIFYKSGKKYTEEYNNTLNKATEMLFKYYHIPQSVAETYLRNLKTSPSLIKNLRHEVDIRITDLNMFRYFAEKENKEYDKNRELNNSAWSDEKIEDFYNKQISSYYGDKSFTDSISFPVISVKQDKKYNKKLTADNPLSLRCIDGKQYQIISKAVKNIKKKEICNIYTKDKNLISYLTDLMEDYTPDSTVEAAMNDKSLGAIIINNHKVNKLKLLSAAPKKYLVKSLSEENYTVIDNKEYYCIDIYKNSKGNTGVCAIAYTDLIIYNGKLYLRPDYKYPEDYAVHVTYLFAGDYIVLRDKKGNKTFEGYYCSVKNIWRSMFYFKSDNKPKTEIKSISSTTDIEKISIDILGKKGGKEKCGEQLLLLQEKK